MKVQSHFSQSGTSGQNDTSVGPASLPDTLAEIQQALREIEERWHLNWWYLHPRVQGTIGFGDSAKVTSDLTTKVILQTQVLIVNRGITITYPSANIPPIRIYTVHLEHGVKKGPVASFTITLWKDVTLDPSDYELDEMNPHVVEKQDKKIAINMTLIRLCQFAAQDIYGSDILHSDAAIGTQSLDSSSKVIKNPKQPLSDAFLRSAFSLAYSMRSSGVMSRFPRKNFCSGM